MLVKCIRRFCLARDYCEIRNYPMDIEHINCDNIVLVKIVLSMKDIWSVKLKDKGCLAKVKKYEKS